MIRIPANQLTFFRKGADVPFALANNPKNAIPGASVDDGERMFTIPVEEMEVEITHEQLADLIDHNIESVESFRDTEELDALHNQIDDLKAVICQWQLVYEASLAHNQALYDLALM